MDEQIIFQQKNRKSYVCEIIEHKDVYKLRVQNIKKEFKSAYFDKNEAVLCAVIEEIKKNGNPQWQKFGFTFNANTNGKTTHICTLGRVIYAAIHQGKISDFSGQRITFKDGDPSNLRGSNLYQPHPTTIDVVVLSGQKFICLKSKSSLDEPKISIADYSEQLLQILQSTHWCYEEKKHFFYTRMDECIYCGHQEPYRCH